MEEWQMYDRAALLKIEEEEEAAFKDLPEELQKFAIANAFDGTSTEGAALADANESTSTANSTPCDVVQQDKDAQNTDATVRSIDLPPLISDERQQEKIQLLSEGFVDWSRGDYGAFVRASAAFGRSDLKQIALEVGKSEAEVKRFADCFWGEIGRTRISEHEYERVERLVSKGEKKISEIRALERGTRVLVSHFSNPWQELEFVHVNCKDKMFSMDEDRHLLCWTRKVRRNNFMMHEPCHSLKSFLVLLVWLRTMDSN
jgi:SWI/SNF-related matrix-associated actin-dependent regulator of chromatin subfamily A member 5